MNTYPIVLCGLERTRCVVVGGGRVAERKVAGLLAGGARPDVISPTLTPALMLLREQGQVVHHERRYVSGDLHGATLAFAATNDPAVNAAVADDAARAGVLVNVADHAASGSFHTPAAVRRGDLLLALSTGGASPGLTARLRAELSAQYGPEYGRALAFAAALRAVPSERLGAAERAELLTWLCSAQALGWLRAGDDDLVALTLQRHLEAARPAEVAP